MTTDSIISVKYIFLDVVAYTKRTVEAQCYIITTLNRIVKGAVNRYHISDDRIIYIPTGDGMCIALLNVSPYDIHVTIAKEILRRIFVNNSKVRDDWRRFEIRVGINQGDDNVVMDINGRKNVTGAGINNTRRIMDLADERQILVSSTVYGNLQPRKAYFHAFSQEFQYEVKHGLTLKMYQLVAPDTDWLSVNTPTVFIDRVKPEPKLTKLAAYYFAHSIKNEGFILNKAREDILNTERLKVLLWFLAKDSEDKSERSPYDIYKGGVMPYGCPDKIEGQFEWFCENISYHVVLRLCSVTLDDAVPLSMQSRYFEGVGQYLVINSQGKEKLKRDWPQIWDEFGLGEL